MHYQHIKIIYSLIAQHYQHLQNPFQKHIVKKTSKEYANFRTGENLPEFQRILDEYLEDETNETFNTFSRKATEQLAAKMNSKPASTGGFVVVVDFTNIFRFILIALVNKKRRLYGK